MEAFAVVGLNLRSPAGTIEEEEWGEAVVDVALVLGDQGVEAPWEACEGSMNGGLGLRRVALAVVRVRSGTRGTFRYVSGLKVAPSCPGPEWRVCESTSGDRAPSLTAGRLSAVKALYLYVRFARSSECAFPPRAMTGLRLVDARRRRGDDDDGDDASSPSDWRVLDGFAGYYNVYGERPRLDAVLSSPLGIDGPREATVAASRGDIPSHFASFVLDAPTDLSLQRTDDVAAPEAFSFEMTDSRGDARHVACVRFDWRLEDAAVDALKRGVERDARGFRPSLSTAWSEAWGDGDDTDSEDEEDDEEEGDEKADVTSLPSPAPLEEKGSLGAHLDDGATYAGFAPIVFCVVFRRPDALACMRTACFELYRLALSRNCRAFQILLATLEAVDLPVPETRVGVRCVFVDGGAGHTRGDSTSLQHEWSLEATQQSMARFGVAPRDASEEHDTTVCKGRER